MLELTIIGNLGSDAEVKEFNGKKFLGFSVAHTEKYKKTTGEEVSTTTWVSCLKRIKDESKLANYLKKGTQVYIRGSVSANAYTNSHGEMVAGINCSVRELQLLGRKESAPVQEQSPQQQPDHLEKEAQAPEDDLPF